MSGWRIAIRTLHQLGGTARTDRVAGLTRLVDAGRALADARELGLVTGDGRRGPGVAATWTLTPLGRDFCEGRVAQAPASRLRQRGRIFVATWLASLPRGIRLQEGST